MNLFLTDCCDDQGVAQDLASNKEQTVEEIAQDFIREITVGVVVPPPENADTIGPFNFPLVWAPFFPMCIPRSRYIRAIPCMQTAVGVSLPELKLGLSESLVGFSSFSAISIGKCRKYPSFFVHFNKK